MKRTAVDKLLEPQPEALSAQAKAQAVNAASVLHQHVAARCHAMITADSTDEGVFINESERQAFIAARNLLGATFRENG